MKKNHSGKRGQQDSTPHSDKVGWIRKFCGRGIFREIWKNRFIVLRGDQLFVSEKEVKEAGRADEVLDLSDYERCEEVRKNKSRSKKNHSKFCLQRCSSPGNMVPNLVFLAVSPEEKESWINILNAAIKRAKNRILDEVTVEDTQLSHLTRDRVRIPHTRRLPTRGHLLAVASTCSSDGMLTLDLIQEEDIPCPQGPDGCRSFRVNLDRSHLAPDCPWSKTDGAVSARTAETSGKSHSLPREVVGSAQTPQPGPRLTQAEKNRCVSMDEIRSVPLSCSLALTPTDAMAPINQLQGLISLKLARTQQLLTEMHGWADGEAGKVTDSAEGARAKAERLLQEATAAWGQAHKVLEEVTELQALYRQLDSTSMVPATKTTRA
ncbi:pleckstrin homology domain-containing family O member 1b [Aulostomus maculatus]